MTPTDEAIVETTPDVKSIPEAQPSAILLLIRLLTDKASSPDGSDLRDELASLMFNIMNNNSYGPQLAEKLDTQIEELYPSLNVRLNGLAGKYNLETLNYNGDSQALNIAQDIIEQGYRRHKSKDNKNQGTSSEEDKNYRPTIPRVKGIRTGLLMANPNETEVHPNIPRAIIGVGIPSDLNDPTCKLEVDYFMSNPEISEAGVIQWLRTKEGFENAKVASLGPFVMVEEIQDDGKIKSGFNNPKHLRYAFNLFSGVRGLLMDKAGVDTITMIASPKLIERLNQFGFNFLESPFTVSPEKISPEGIPVSEIMRKYPRYWNPDNADKQPKLYYAKLEDLAKALPHLEQMVSFIEQAGNKSEA